MSYQVFARKYRPQTFDDVLGQDHVVQTLKNAIEQKRLAHAYLFVGPRGTGKTSTARIFAKALNCPNGPSVHFDPNDPVCQEIAEGRSLDVLEIDGASNNGVEQVRDLRDNVQFSPSSGQFRIFYIDEVHMLSKPAFNALLKTLEEPPSHVKFIFATTEAHKILPTILSRCQRFDLRPISTDVIAAHLLHIASEEGVNLSEGAAYAVAKAADGGMRDAQSMLDQLVSFCGSAIEESHVLDIFGITSRETVCQAIGHMMGRRIPAVLQIIHEQSEAGRDLTQFLGEMIFGVREVLISKVDATVALEGISQSLRDQLQACLVATDTTKLLRLIEILAETQERMKWATNKRLHLEIGLIKGVHSLSEANISDIIRALEGAPLTECLPAVASSPVFAQTPVAPVADVPAPVATVLPVTAPTTPAPVTSDTEAPSPEPQPVATPLDAVPTPTAVPVETVESVELVDVPEPAIPVTRTEDFSENQEKEEIAPEIDILVEPSEEELPVEVMATEPEAVPEPESEPKELLAPVEEATPVPALASETEADLPEIPAAAPEVGNAEMPSEKKEEAPAQVFVAEDRTPVSSLFDEWEDVAPVPAPAPAAADPVAPKSTPMSVQEIRAAYIPSPLEDELSLFGNLDEQPEPPSVPHLVVPAVPVSKEEEEVYSPSDEEPGATMEEPFEGDTLELLSPSYIDVNTEPLFPWVEEDTEIQQEVSFNGAELWEETLRFLSNNAPINYLSIKHIPFLKTEGRSLVVGVNPNDLMARDILISKEIKGKIEQFLAEKSGAKLKFYTEATEQAAMPEELDMEPTPVYIPEPVVQAPPSPVEEEPEPEPEPQEEEIAFYEDPLIEEALKIFHAKIIS